MTFFRSGKDFPLGGLFCLLLPVLVDFVGCEEAGAASLPPLSAQDIRLSVRLDSMPELRGLHIIGVGDMMLGTNYPSASYLPPDGGGSLLDEVRELLVAADVTFGNLEGSLVDSGGTPKTCQDMSRCYVFRSPTAYARYFADAGFDLLSLANNHSGDFGPEGRRQTRAALDSTGIAYAGLTGGYEKAIIIRDSIRYGLAAFAPNSGTCDIRQVEKAAALVSELAAECDIVIVSFHGGAEGAAHQHVPRGTETYLGENRGNVYAFAHAVIDAGADVVFGHGPHVTRAIELYNDRLICYSLGNFCTYGRFSLTGPASLAPIVDVTVDTSGRFLEGHITATYQQKTHGPRIDPEKRVISLMRQLSRDDFPESPLFITEGGKIVRMGGEAEVEAKE